MDCVETRTMLSPYHDGELVPADRARVDEHLRGCGECSSALARLAEIDAHAGVPDPGPEYWERFNRRVMERVEGAPAPEKVLRPKRGWARRRLPYFIPAAAAAALLLVVVRQTGIDPLTRTVPPPASPAATQASPQAPPEKAPKALAEEASQELPRTPRPAPPQAAHRGEAPESRPSADVSSAPRA
ncbi:MAG: zf-HC2 domain-containing protein, partial [Deltaproteobacteria bacterium]|nr:zf-HC2 domain-containing protein [Deltaproteobacteria bacterium]